MKISRSFPWRPACFVIASFLFGLLIMPLQSSLPAAGGPELCDFRITIDAVITDEPPGPIHIGFDAKIELAALAAGPSSPAIAASRVLINHTIEVPLNASLSTPGRLHFHRIFDVDVGTLGPEALIEVFAQTTPTISAPGATPPKPQASARIILKPRITWVSPAYGAIVRIMGDMTVLSPRYPPLEIKWKNNGFSPVYNLFVMETGTGRIVHRIRGLVAESYMVPASVFESGKRYRVQVDNITQGALPLTISGPCSSKSSGQYCAVATGRFTVVKL